MDIDIKNAKIDLIQWLTTIEDPSLIQKLMQVRSDESNDWWESITESEKESITKGISEANHGALKPYSEAKKIYEKWL
ncbi:hypothetical protein LB452_11060 [Psychroflexus sp. CAK8W]|uniref:Addiction module component n=1 Tax=Psychroflexus longus TaxID=2873596 RepID=A0ABS7XN27_9FLAO|nr:hypothetical protein [Psychroflexus longus]MBZ9779461.1 hypothetical protein [Psychroflexus longus]